MDKLANHGYTSDTSVSNNMLNDAVKASSKFLSIQNVIDSMKADQIAAEREAVEEILGSDYAGKTISEVSSTILSAKAKTYDTENKSHAYMNSLNDNRSTVKRLIQERKAEIFLEKYCGIQLEKNFWINSSDGVIYYPDDTTGNVDTGAITGSDANITLTAGDVIYGTTLTSDMMTTLAAKDGVSLSGGKLIVGTGVEKTASSVVPEIGNLYTALTTQGQSISTGANDWIVVTGDAADTIVTGGADSIVAGAGNDKITVGADNASINTGEGSDTVEISATVSNVTINDLDASDALTISGTFQIGKAALDDTMLVVTDKTGTRQIRLGNLDRARNARVNGNTIATWLSNAGFNIDSLSSTSSSYVAEDAPATAITEEGGGRIDVDEDYKPAEPTEFVSRSESDPPLISSTAKVNVNLDDVETTSGYYTIGGYKVGEISSAFPNISTFTKNGLTIKLLGTTTDTSGGTNNIKSKTLDELTTDQKTIVAGLFKWWAKECLKLNEETYGISFKSPTAAVNEIGLFFYTGSGNTLASVWNSSYSTGITANLKLNVNMKYYSGISADNTDGVGTGTNAYLDRTLAHEFTHAVMGTNIRYFRYLPQFIKEGAAELTHGTDDERGHTIFNLAYDSSKLNNALNLTNTGTGTADAYAGGYMFLRYFARQAALQDLVDYDAASDVSWSVKNNTNDSTATCSIGGVVVATIKGLAKGLAAKGTTIDGISVSGDTITLSRGVLGTKDVTLTSSGYKLALADGISDAIDSATNRAWTVNKGTATLKANVTAGYSLSDDAKSVKYVAAKNGYVLAKVEGLAKSGVSASDFNTTSTVITLKKSMLGTSKVKVTGNGYTLALAADAPKPATYSPEWILNKTTAYYTQNTGAGFTLADDAKSASYSAAVTTALATVSGIKKVTTDNKTAIANAISIDGKVITLGKDALATSKVTVKGDGYTLALAANAPRPTLQTPEWTLSKTTATYKQTKTDGFTLATDGKSASYSKPATTTLATVNGIKKVTTDNKTAIENAISIDGKVITLGKDALDTSKVTVKGDGYTLATDAASSTVTTKDRWLVSGTTATYDRLQNPYFSSSTDKKKLTYHKETKTANLVKVTGLVKGATVNGTTVSDKNGKAVLSLADNIVTLTNNESCGKKVTVSLASGYTLNNQLTAPAVTKTYLTVKSGKAALKQEKTDGYTLTTNEKTGVKTLTYNAAKTGKNTLTLTTVSGLDKTLTDTDGTLAGLTYNLTDNTVTVDNRILTTSDVKVTGDYKLKLVTTGDYAVPTATKEATIWAVKDTTATYKKVNIGYFTPKNDKTYTYNKEKLLETYATVSGLKKNAPLDSISLSGKVITLSKDALVETPKANTKISLGKKDDYTLALATDVTKVEYNAPTWSHSKSTATYKSSVKTAGYLPADDAKTISYIPSTATKTLATLSGVKSASGITVAGNVITLTDAALNKKKVTLGKNDPYTLALGNASLEPTPGDETWKISDKTKATLSVTYSTGYTTSADAKAINYASKATTKTLAQISGINKSADISTFKAVADGDTKKISLAAAQLGTKVTVSGEYKFDFASDYNSAAITGSKAADNISVAGTGLSITGGKGDDVINLGGSANVFVYASGDGNDVIADFTAASDKIKITSSTTPTVASDGSDAVVTVGTGSIKLTGAAGQTITVLDKNNKAKTYSTPAADLLLDDNYATTTELSEIVKPASATYTPYDFDTTLSLTKEEKFTPAISYSKEK